MGLESVYKDMASWYRGLHEYIFESPEFVPLQEFLVLPKDQTQHLHSWHMLFGELRNRFLWADQLRNLMAKAILGYTQERLKIPRSPWIHDSSVQVLSNRLAKCGNLMLPQIPKEKAAEMRKYFETQPVFSQDRSRLIPLNELPTTLNTAEYPVKSVLRCPHLLEYATDPALLSIIETYLGAPPTAIIATAWRSFAGREAAKDSQLFHYDFADYRFCNLFFYLTDVDMNSGPHVYIEGTHTAEHLKQLIDGKFPGDVLEQFVQWYNFQLRKSDAEVARFIGKEPKYFLGPAGTTFLVDTRGIHKGLLPETSDRLLAQITFALTPAIQTELSEGPDVLELPERLRRPPLNYTYRLLIGSSNSYRET